MHRNPKNFAKICFIKQQVIARKLSRLFVKMQLNKLHLFVNELYRSIALFNTRLCLIYIDTKTNRNIFLISLFKRKRVCQPTGIFEKIIQSYTLLTTYPRSLSSVSYFDEVLTSFEAI